MAVADEDVLFQSLKIFMVLILLLYESNGKKTQTYYMDGADCGDSKYLGGATVFSHHAEENEEYRKNIGCRITFKAENDDWKLMVRVEQLHMPDVTFNQICNDALYIYDTSNIYGTPIEAAGGNKGLCGEELPPFIYSSGPYLTIFFRTDRSGPPGRGFKLVITAYSDEFKEFQNCGSNFLCSNEKCIDEDLECDSVNHCGDYSDESQTSGAYCGLNGGENENNSINKNKTNSTKEENLWDKLLSLGIAASVAIVAGSVVVVIVIVVCMICLCRRCSRKKPEGNNVPTSPAHTNTSSNHGNNAYSQANNIPMGVSSAMPQYTEATGYYPVPQQYTPYPNHPMGGGVAYSPMVMRDRESYSQSSAYSSLPPQSVQSSGFSSQPMHTKPTHCRSLTPTSSRSGKSTSDVTYHSNPEKVAFPVHL